MSGERSRDLHDMNEELQYRRELLAEIVRLRAVIQEVVDDEEACQADGYRPEIRMAEKLKAALLEPNTPAPDP